MGLGPEESFQKKKKKWLRNIWKNMFITLEIRENANQNNLVISLYSSQNGKDQQSN